MKKFAIRLATALALFCMTAQAFAMNSVLDTYEGDEISQTMSDLERMYRFVDSNFLYDIDRKKVYEAMATAMLDALDDRWTMYISSSESEQYEESITGKYSGVGIILSKSSVQNQKSDDERTLYVQVGTVFRGSPAQRAGLVTGDLITEIDGQGVLEKTATECSKMLRGPRGTKVIVRVRRGNVEFELDIIRDEINTPTVESEMLPGGVFYIRINQFTQSTSRQVRDEFRNIDHVNSIILDLRSNGGGDVNSCLAVANLFLEGGNVLIDTISKVKSRNKTHYSSAGTIVPTDANMVVLINKGTASAAEILSVALRDNGRAILVGEKSYGKGVMQYTSQYKDGIVNVTTAEYVSGSGRKVNKIGLDPDVSVSEAEMKDDEVKNAIEAQKSGAVHDFVRRNPKYDIAVVEKGIDELIVEYPAPRKALASLLLMEYKNTSERANNTIAYPMYDEVLKTAIDIIERANSTGGSVFDFIGEFQTQQPEPDLEKAAND